MRFLAISAFALGCNAPLAAATPEQHEVAERFASAITGENELVISDFSQPLTEEEKQFFARYIECDPHNINSVAANRNEAASENRVLVRFTCPRTPDRYPIYISLYFDGPKIAAIETHNADLLTSTDD